MIPLSKPATFTVKFPRLSGSFENTIINGTNRPGAILTLEFLFPDFLARMLSMASILRDPSLSSEIKFPQNTVLLFTLILSFVMSVPVTLTWLHGIVDLFIIFPVMTNKVPAEELVMNLPLILFLSGMGLPGIGLTRVLDARYWVRKGILKSETYGILIPFMMAIL